jgi:hypothetical protein
MPQRGALRNKLITITSQPAWRLRVGGLVWIWPALLFTFRYVAYVAAPRPYFTNAHIAMSEHGHSAIFWGLLLHAWPHLFGGESCV